MARIRTIKPEAFASESLAMVSLSAERTFFGLLTQADDRGRFRDQAAVIAGLLWSLRPDHGPVGVDDDLSQLQNAGLICRYEGCDGKRYLHLVTFARHQKINRPSGVRHPDCPHHDLGHPGPVREPALRTHADLTEHSVSPHGAEAAPPLVEEGAGQTPLRESSSPTHGGLTEGSVSPHGPDLGPRNVDLGSSPSGGASAPAPASVSVQDLIGEYVAACAERPPGSVLGHLGREVRNLLAEGIKADHIRAALVRQRAKGVHPSVLPSLVNDVMNTPTRSTAPRRAWTNPADTAAAYGGQL
ncbi:hypothetical protein J8N05_32390 [Streptomyces sp. BH-SS-21]|uniref:Phage or prophage related protein n=1 Tax=Streptomyces liliiviolaceus TaxID=2823109 RepID=A0A940XZD6_9ACTN|nr:hypothetical protein [Streptomyces liliiviolaceus]MBQ0852871.1 hypothetical protein [Streptomyces liliiviolaceus]